jgi:hypothetical protein
MREDVAVEVSNTRRPLWRRTSAVGLAVLLCTALVGTATAAPASGGRHLEGFSLLSKRVAIKKLPFSMRLSFQRVHGFGHGHPKVRGPVWFGEVKRPGSTIVAAGVKGWVCEEVERMAANGSGSGSGSCMPLAEARELQMLSLSQSCFGAHVHARVTGLVPDGVTGLELLKKEGTVVRTVPVLENVVSFPVGDEVVLLRGTGDAAAEELEWRVPSASGGPGKAKDRRVSSCIASTFGAVTDTVGLLPVGR